MVQKKSTSNEAFIPNKHVFLTSILLAILTIGMVVYDYSIGESIFDGSTVQVLGDQVSPVLSPSVTPTVTP